MNRRRFLRLTGATAVVIGTSACAAGSDYDARVLAQPELLVTLGAGAVRAIGARYRALTPSERDATALRASILASRPMRARLLPGSGTPVASLVHDDFAEGRTIVLEGWILSVTEARQCALFSLLSA
ncbi:MAG TPA: hypothetical protein VJN70_19310 [Gemmatimonadaceae bacterium]|nr:hypothetical protein [Gemmatimonadaceae bacterium]